MRLITAAILVPVLVGSVIWLPDSYFALLFGVFATIGSWEWTQFMRLQKLLSKLVYVALVVVALILCWHYAMNATNLVLVGLLLGFVWWLCALILVLLYPRYTWVRNNLFAVGLTGILVLIPCWLAIVVLRNNYEQGVSLVLFLVALIAVADSGAYFGGRKWGANKLAPQVSPGKSWEGVYSGLACVAVLALAGAWFLGLHEHGWQSVGLFIGISIFTAMFSVLGDLSESMFKRHVGIKDSGSILPGHGGILDRIDSITAAAPVFVICLSIFFSNQSSLFAKL